MPDVTLRHLPVGQVWQRQATALAKPAFLGAIALSDDESGTIELWVAL
ncbi:MAG: hypothetical protein AB4042_04450 [Leptolyngbyaceae cyanobacterium]